MDNLFNILKNKNNKAALVNLREVFDIRSGEEIV